MSDPRRGLPSVSALLEREAIRALFEQAPRPVVVDAVRQAIDEGRRGAARPPYRGVWCPLPPSRDGPRCHVRRAQRRLPPA